MDGRLAGLIGAVATVGVLLLTPEQSDALVLSGLLWMTVGIYIGMALMTGQRAARTQVLGGIPVLVLATMGVWSPWLLVAAWLVHPAWDVAHHAGWIKTPIHPITVPFCIVYDVLMAGAAAALALGWL